MKRNSDEVTMKTTVDSVGAQDGQPAMEATVQLAHGEDERVRSERSRRSYRDSDAWHTANQTP